MVECRILAIDLRAKFLGFAVLEGPRTLLDWGRKPFRNSGSQDNAIVMRKKVAGLLTFFAPSVVVLKHTSGRKDQKLLRNKNVIKAIKCEAKMQSVQFACFTRKEIRQTFRQSCNTNKYKIARFVSEIFPEIAWKLPPSRKNWQPEHHNMAIFDAISLGIAYLAEFDRMPKSDGEHKKDE